MLVNTGLYLLGETIRCIRFRKKTLDTFGTFLQRSNQLECENLVQDMELAIKGICRIINSQEL